MSPQRSHKSASPVFRGTGSPSSPSEDSLPMPSTPPTPSSPRYVRFAAAASPVTGSSRGPTLDEAWSFHHFEVHCAQDCLQCRRPYEAYQAGHRLCQNGYALASSILVFVYPHHNHVYSRASRSTESIRVEVDPGYKNSLQMLRLVNERGENAIRPLSPQPVNYGRTHHGAHATHMRNDSGVHVPQHTQYGYTSLTPAPGYVVLNTIPMNATHGRSSRSSRSPPKRERSSSTTANLGVHDGHLVVDYVDTRRHRR